MTSKPRHSAQAPDPKRRDLDRPSGYAWEVRVGEALLGYRAPRRRAGKGPMICRLRIREAIELILHRFRGPVDTDDGDIFVAFVARHVVDIARDPLAYVAAFANAWTPAVPILEVQSIVAAVVANPPPRLKADEAAWRLRVTAEERAALGLTTIGALGQSSSDRAERRRLQKAEYSRQRRRAAGAIPREQYEAKSITARSKAEGVSRSTLYRRRAKGCDRTEPT